MFKGKGLYLILAAVGLGALALGVYDKTGGAGVVESGSLKGEGTDRFHWRIRKEAGPEGFADVFVGEISPDAEVFEEVARGPLLSPVKGLTLETIALKPGFSG